MSPVHRCEPCEAAGFTIHLNCPGVGGEPTLSRASHVCRSSHHEERWSCPGGQQEPCIPRRRRVPSRAKERSCRLRRSKCTRCTAGAGRQRPFAATRHATGGAGVPAQMPIDSEISARKQWASVPADNSFGSDTSARVNGRRVITSERGGAQAIAGGCKESSDEGCEGSRGQTYEVPPRTQRDADAGRCRDAGSNGS